MIFSNFFKDKKGKVVVAQWPNWPLWVALIFFLLKYFPHSIVQDVSFWGLILTLLYWSYLEIFFGVNLWRRLLGMLVVMSQIYKLIKFFSIW